MKSIFFFAAASLGLALSPAMAADIVQPSPPEVFNWTGGYLGVNAGWVWQGINSPPGEVQPDDNGFTIGAHAGYNYEFPQNFVIGIDGDIRYVDLSASAPCFNPSYTCSTKQQWEGAIRGKVGYAFDRFLPYVAGGVAFTRFEGSTNNGTNFPDAKTLTGWTIGVGVDYAMTDHVLIGLEYRHSDFGSHDFTYDDVYNDVSLKTDTVLARLSYKF